MARRKSLWIGILALALVFGLAACDLLNGDDTGGIDTVGSLTITGIPAEFNGKYVFAEGETVSAYLIAAASINRDDTGTAGRISGGSVTLKVWKLDEASERIVSFNGNGKAEFFIAILNSANLEEWNGEDSAGYGYVEVTFSGGKGSGTFVEEEADIDVTLSSVTADGDETESTTQLTLTFSAAITGLSAGDITLLRPTDSTFTGTITKGTLSGPTPAGSAVTYTLPITPKGATSGGTIRVRVEKEGYDISGSPKTVEIFYSNEEAAKPAASKEAGTYTEALSVTLTSATTGAEIYYTTNGNEPTKSSTKYSGTAIAISKTTTLKAIAVKEGMDNSDILTVVYTLKAVKPAAGTQAGEVATGTAITLTTTTEGADIYYTTDGSAPTAGSTKYTAAIAITGAMTIKAIAVKADWENSDVLEAAYTVPLVIDVSGATLADKLAWVKTNAASGTTYTLEVDDDEAIAPHTLSYTGKSNITVILKGIGGEQEISLSSNGSLFTVAEGVTLVLDKDITLKGHAGNNKSLVWVDANGKLIMETGSKITGNKTTGNGGGVNVSQSMYYNGGTFIMNGGEISGNTADAGLGEGGNGGGVYIDCATTATFTMNGGKITGNTSSYRGGGVFISEDSTFTMNGGEISGNTAAGGGGVLVYGTIRIVTGTIYGSDETDPALKNTATTGAALHVDADAAERGTFTGTTWTKKGDLSTSETTVTVLNGVLQL